MRASAFRRAGHLPSLVAAFIHFDVSFMVWVLLGALGAYVAEDLGLGPAQKGLMVAVPPLGGAAFRIVLGVVADRRGARATGLMTLGLTLVPLAWGWLAGGSLIQVLGIGLLLGVAGASFAVALPLASRWYPAEHQGLALGIAGAGNSGTIVAALAAPRLAEHVGWHAVFGLAALPVTATWFAFALLAREPPRPTSPPGGLASVLSEPDARWFCGFYAVTFGGFVGLASYLPIFFVDRFDLGKVTAAGYAALCTAAGSLIRPLGGAIADRLGGTRVLAAVLAAVAAIGVLLAGQPALGATTALLLVTTGALGAGNGAVFQLVPQRFPERIGAVTGLVGAAGGVGGFLLPFGLGALHESTGSFAAGFGAFAAVAAAAGVAVMMRHQTWRRAWSLVAV